MAVKNARIARWINTNVRSMQAYHVQDAGGFIKLDAMENPYAISESLRTSWLQTLQAAELNRYPDAASVALKAALQDQWQLPADKPLIIGNGSDELIQMLLLAVNGQQRTIIAPEPGFVMYPVLSKLFNMRYVGVPLRDDFRLNTAAMLAAVEQHEPAIVFIASPNNPTGNCFDESAVTSIIEAAPGLVVLDEAYFIFNDGSLVKLLDRYEHVLVMRTLSKLGLAGLRIGILAGAQDWIDEINKVRLPYNINTLSQLSAEFYLQHFTELKQQAGQIVEQRGELFAALNALPQFKVYRSDANFILFRCLEKSADSIHAALKQQQVLIKNLHGSHPLLDQCLRVTVGTGEENAAFLDALKQAV